MALGADAGAFWSATMLIAWMRACERRQSRRVMRKSYRDFAEQSAGVLASLDHDLEKWEPVFP